MFALERFALLPSSMNRSRLCSPVSLLFYETKQGHVKDVAAPCMRDFLVYVLSALIILLVKGTVPYDRLFVGFVAQHCCSFHGLDQATGAFRRMFTGGA